MNKEVWGILDVLTYLKNREKELEELQEVYKMWGVGNKKASENIHALNELYILERTIEEHMEQEGGE